MPKAVMSAAEILGTAVPVATEEVPVVETKAPSTEKPEAPAAGFETPPPAEETAPAPSAESVLSGAAEEPDPAEAELARIEFDAGVALAREGRPLPEAASDNAKRGFASVPPVLAAASVPPAEASEPGEAEVVAVAEAAPVRKNWTFVKNIHPGEIIRFKDGTELVFPGALFGTSDPELAQKILAVADVHHIVLQ